MMVRASAAFVAVSAALLLATGASASTRAVGGTSTTVYTVAFDSASLPANVDKLIADAGGPIVLRLPEIGGLGVSSSNPAFAAKISASASVAAAGSAAPSVVSGRPGDGGAWVRKDNRGRG